MLDACFDAGHLLSLDSPLALATSIDTHESHDHDHVIQNDDIENSCSLGDANADSLLDILDVVLVLLFLLDDPTDVERHCIDVNGDLEISVSDLVSILDSMITGIAI